LVLTTSDGPSLPYRKSTVSLRTGLIFTVRINLKSFPWAVRRIQGTSATSDVCYWVNHVRRCSCLASKMQEKQTELETESKLHGR